jgi:hypothetical protein
MGFRVEDQGVATAHVGGTAGGLLFPSGNHRRVVWEDEGVKPPEGIFPCRLKRHESIVAAEKPYFPARTITLTGAKVAGFSCRKKIGLSGATPCDPEVRT